MPSIPHAPGRCLVNSIINESEVSDPVLSDTRMQLAHPPGNWAGHSTPPFSLTHTRAQRHTHTHTTHFLIRTHWQSLAHSLGHIHFLSNTPTLTYAYAFTYTEEQTQAHERACNFLILATSRVEMPCSRPPSARAGSDVRPEEDSLPSQGHFETTGTAALTTIPPGQPPLYIPAPVPSVPCALRLHSSRSS